MADPTRPHPQETRPYAATLSRAEDLWWMAETGESASGAARRLGISFTALEKWCRVHDHLLWRRLMDHEPRDPNKHSGTNQWGKGRAS